MALDLSGATLSASAAGCGTSYLCWLPLAPGVGTATGVLVGLGGADVEVAKGVVLGLWVGMMVPTVVGLPLVGVCEPLAGVLGAVAVISGVALGEGRNISSVLVGTLLAKNNSTFVFGQYGVGNSPEGTHTRTSLMPGGLMNRCRSESSRAWTIKLCHIGPAVVTLRTLTIGVLSALPTQTPVTSCGV